MKTRTILSMATLALLYSSSASATSQNVAGLTIYSVYPGPDGSFILLFNEAAANLNSPCTGPLFNGGNGFSYKYYSVKAGENGVTADGVKTMLASALLAFARGGVVTMSVVFDDVAINSHCPINRFSTP